MRRSLHERLAASASLAEWHRIVMDAAADGPSEPLLLSVVQEDGDTAECRVRLPAHPNADDGKTLVRYAGALLNNLAMTRGGVSVEVGFSDERFAEKVLDELLQRYPQVQEVLADFHQRPARFRVRPDATAAPSRDCCGLVNAPPATAAGVADGVVIGVNVGQSQLKLATLIDGKPVASLQAVVATWDGNPVHAYPALRERIVAVLDRYLDSNGLRRRLVALGIAVGGIVRRGRITTRSGIAAGMSDADFDGLRDIVTDLSRRYDVPTALVQDVVAKATALTRHYRLERALVLDLGTSTGGAYVDASGSIPDWLGQVGRVVVDPSERAVPRPDRMAAGVLSQYLSAVGCLRIARAVGLPCDSLQDFDLLLACGNPSALRSMERFDRVFRDALGLLGLCYELRTVVVSGGMVAGSVGAALVRRSLAVPDAGTPVVTVSPEPTFDGAYGAAWFASEHSRACSRPAAPR